MGWVGRQIGGRAVKCKWSKRGGGKEKTGVKGLRFHLSQGTGD